MSRFTGVLRRYGAPVLVAGALVSGPLVSSSVTSHAATPTTCVRVSSVTCTTVPLGPGLTPGAVAGGTYRNDDAFDGFVVTGSGNDTVDALKQGYSCIDLGLNRNYGHNLHYYLCLYRLT